MQRLRDRGWVVEETDSFIALNRRGLDLQNVAMNYFM
jgi:hypothetical protein